MNKLQLAKAKACQTRRKTSMNKSKYVDKMTDLVEDTLVKKGVSDDFTIEDNYEEDGEMSMTLTHDASGHEVTFQLQSLYDQKKEADIKVKDQYAENLKTQVESFVDREILAERASRAQARNNNAMSEDYDEYEDEDSYEDYEDYDDYEDGDDDYEDSEEEEVLEDSEQSDAAPTVGQLIEHNEPWDGAGAPSQAESEEKPAISSAITGLFKPVEFVNINGDGSAKAASLPKAMQEKTLDEITRRFGVQIKSLYDGGAIVVRPNANDVVVFDAEKFGKDDVAEMLTDMMEEGGSKDIIEVEPERDEPGLP